MRVYVTTTIKRANVPISFSSFGNKVTKGLPDAIAKSLRPRYQRADSIVFAFHHIRKSLISSHISNDEMTNTIRTFDILVNDWNSRCIYKNVTSIDSNFYYYNNRWNLEQPAAHLNGSHDFDRWLSLTLIFKKFQLKQIIGFISMKIKLPRWRNLAYS